MLEELQILKALSGGKLTARQIALVLVGHGFELNMKNRLATLVKLGLVIVDELDDTVDQIFATITEKGSELVTLLERKHAGEMTIDLFPDEAKEA